MDIEKPADPREQILVLDLVKALQKHALGEEGGKMTATQVSAAIALLKKTLPDLPGPVRSPVAEDKTRKAHEEALQELE